MQQAVDRGGTVLLKGRFDFGDTGSVKIANDVSVRGELDERGAPRTVIRGGYRTFESFPPASMPMPAGPKIEIANIHFDAALWTPLRLAHASRLTIARNRITGVRPHPSPERPQIGLQQGILVGATFPTDRTQQYRPGSVVGQVTITDNRVDLTTEAPAQTMAQGIFMSWTTGITARIARNTIVNAARNGIEVVDNYAGKDRGGYVVIQENHVATATEGFALPTPRTPNGIAVGYLPRKRGYAERDGVIGHAILTNTVVPRGRTSVGVNVLTDAALVRKNQVISQGAMAHAIRVLGSNTIIGQNTIEGAGELGIWLGRNASGNELDGNDFERFQAAVADVMLVKGASDNVVRGSVGSVSDPGAGNQVHGLTRLAR